MGIYIPNMKLPKEDDYKYAMTLVVLHDGTVLAPLGKEIGRAIEVSPHGRLGDLDALMLRVDCYGTNKFGMLDEDIREFIGCAPTIIPAEGGADNG